MRSMIMKSILAAVLGVVIFVPPVMAETAIGARSSSAEATVPSPADVRSLIEIANTVARQLPSRTAVARIADEHDRLFLTNVWAHVETAQQADRLTAAELGEFAAQLQASVVAAQVGASRCSTMVFKAALLDADSNSNEAQSSLVAARAGGCSCVQRCYNEWQANLATCNGSYWCQVGFNLLFELCLADCLVPG